MEFSKEQANKTTPYVSVNTLTKSKGRGLSVYPPYVGVASQMPRSESVAKLNPVVQQKQSKGEQSQGKESSEKAEPGVFDRVLAVGLGGAAEIVEKTPTGCFVPVPGFEFMQNFFKGMMVGALERLSQEKVAHLWRIFQNVARAVNSVEYMKAYFWGFLRGFFGDFILIWELPGIVKNTADFLGNLITQIKELSKEDYEAFAGRIDEIKALVVTSGREYIDSIMRDVQAGKASRLIIELLQTVADFSQETGKTVGGYVTGTMLEYFSKEYKELGKELGGVMGEASGTIAFTVLLAAITAGGGAVWGAVRAGIKTVTGIIGKGVGLATKAIATTLKNISRVFGVLIDGTRVVIKGFGKGAAKLFKGIKGKLDEVLVKVKQLVDDLLERLSRKRAVIPNKELIPGTPEHKLQRWIDYQKKYPERYPEVTDTIDSKWSKQYDTIIANGKAGRGFEGEALSKLGYKKNNMVFIDEEGSGFIPDSIKGNPIEIEWGKPYDFVEVKGWQELSNTGNLKAMLDYVEKYGGSIEAVLRSAKHPSGITKLSDPLQKRLNKLIASGKAKIIRIP